ncbi:MAG: DinB family protein [Planctomycetota bacterium]
MSELRSEFLQTCEKNATETLGLLTELEKISDDQANWKPGAKRWSVNECLKHLVQSVGLYRKNLAGAIEKLKAKGPKADEPSGRSTLVGRFLLGALEPAKNKKLKAAGPFKLKASDIDLATEIAALRDCIEWLGQMMIEADGFDFGRVKLRTPVFLKISLAQTFRVQSLHNLRHVKQAIKVTNESEFPAA